MLIVILLDKQNMIYHMLIIAVTIVIIGSSSSSFVSAFPIQSAIHHHQFDKRQDSDNSNDGRSSSSSDTKSSDNSNNKGNGNNNNKNNNQGTNEGSNTGTDNNLQSIESRKTDGQPQGTGTTMAPSIDTITPQTPLLPATNSSTNHSDPTTNTKNSTPFRLPMPFP
jgi:cytoskeletal protein RodZ